MPNSEGKRRRQQGDDEWRPVAFERRISGATYVRVELLKGRWERPWRWVVFNLAASNYQKILATGEKADKDLAMAAAMEEIEKRTQRAKLAERGRRMLALGKE